MPTGIKDLRITQIGLETTKGAAVAQTNRLVSLAEFNPNEMAYEPQPQIGVMMENPTSDILPKRWTDIDWKGEATYEQLLYLMEMSAKGGVTPTGAMADKTWAYPFTVSADPALKTFTICRRMTDGTINWDEQCAFVFANSYTISAAIGGTVMFDAKLIGRPVDITPTMTGAIAVPSVNFIASADVKIYIDDTFAALGTNALAESAVDWQLSVDPQYQPKFFQDGRADRSFTNYGLKRLTYNLKLNAEANAKVMDKTTGERNRASTRAFRYVRIKATGAVLGGSFYSLQIDGIFRYKEGQFDQKGEREGNDLVPLELIGAYDLSNTTPLKVSITNALSALP